MFLFNGGAANIMNSDELKNIFSTGPEKPKRKKSTKAKHSRKLSMINIGQILLACFLFFVIFSQTAEIMAGLKNKSEDLNEVNADIPGKISPYADKKANAAPAQAIDDGNNGELPAINDQKNSAEDQKTSGAIFILGEHEGKLAVLSPDRATVYEVFDVYISTLPDYDKNLLQEGIKITAAEELRSLLEDYSS